MDFLSYARHRMITQQCQSCGITDNAVLSVLEQVPRDAFVPSIYHPFAYADMRLPLGHGECMLMPLEEARLLASLSVQPCERVLEIGTGSAYLTALLAKLARHVDSVDIFDDFIQSAREKLDEQAIHNVALQQADGLAWLIKKNHSYDVIVLTGSLVKLPKHLLSLINKGGRFFAFLGTPSLVRAVCMIRLGETEWKHQVLFETPLRGLTTE